MRYWIMRTAGAAVFAALAGAAHAAGSVTGPVVTEAAVVPSELERACAASAARLTNSPPAAIYVQGRIAGANPPAVQLWAGGGHWLCSPLPDGKVGFRAKPRNTGTGFQNVRAIQ